MAIKTNFNYRGIEIPNAVIKVNRLFGSKREGWSSLVGVYNITTEEVPVLEADSETVYQTAEVYNLIEEFNHSASYAADERGYVSVYKSLTVKFGGIEV